VTVVAVVAVVTGETISYFPYGSCIGKTVRYLIEGRRLGKTVVWWIEVEVGCLVQ
jgi:hypothetical protein